ncbi:hypothetical protein NBZ79_02800 [Sneathiella marina]|uniref:Secreted protein n=1 Tax=Sneathiella marina TaxID=2950108 RepID=A0ABY4WB56_9PROT|nr:hypothetical protein [Sneathiella marina]USG61901.1 hypothetical protein NBZ79_02800 [Sneathiella marina]
MLTRLKITAVLALMLPVSAICSVSAEQRSDCTDIAIDYTDNSSLTVQEQATAMEQAFYDSLNKFDSCLTEENNSSSEAFSAGAQGGGAGASGSISGTGTGSADGSTPTESTSAGAVASSGISGSQKQSEAEKLEGALQGDQEQDPQSSDEPEPRQENTQSANVLQNGKTPDDIPATDNDSLLESKIREAAENETDPETKAKLWNEYRKYKGLPLK